MTRLIITFALGILLIGVAFWEHNFIHGSYTHLSEQLDSLSAIIYSQENIDTEANIEKAEEMYRYWVKREKHLAILARHTDLTFISDSLIYIKNFIRFNNKEEACVGIEKLKYLIDTHSFNVGTSIQNVI